MLRWTSCAMYRSLHPLLVSMGVVGLFFRRGDNAVSDQAYERGTSKLCKRRVSFGQIYCSINVLCQWLNFLRLLSVFATGESSLGAALFFNMISVLWVLMCVCHTTACYQACARDQGWNRFFLEWAKLHPNLKEDDAYFKHIHKKTVICSVVVWVLVITNVGFLAYALYDTSLAHGYFSPVAATSPYIPVLRPFVLLSYFFNCCSWLLPLAVDYQLCMILYYEFKNFNNDLEALVDEDGTFRGDIHTFRRRHMQICKALGHADVILSLQMAATLLQSIICICLLVYNVLWSEGLIENTLVLVMHIFWLTSGLGQMGIVVIGGASINHQAHASHDVIHQIRMDDMSPTDSHQLTVFSQRVGHGSIGLTALEMFVFDKPSILTILGMVITYILLLVQFKTSTPGPAVCNSTSVL